MTPVLALFLRSLRSNTRSKFTYLGRAALGLVTLLFIVLTHLRRGWSGAPGLEFFSLLIHLQACFLLLGAGSYFASAITEEKEDGTLGLLRLTRLDPLSILLGKSTSRLCGGLSMLLAQFPFTLLAVTLGGVTLAQVAAAYCTLGAFLFFLCNLALLSSVLTPRTGAAACLLVALLVAAWIAPALLLQGEDLLVSLGLVPEAHWGYWLWREADALEKLSPFSALEGILATGFSGPLLGWQVRCNLLAGLGCFLLAWAVFDRFSGGPSSLSTAPRTAMPRLLRGSPAGRATLDAIAWKDGHFLHGGPRARLGKYLGYGLLLLLLTKYRLYPQPSISAFWDLAWIVFWLVTVALTAELCFGSARMLRTEIAQGTLSSLFLTPFDLAYILRAKRRCCMRALKPAAIVLGGGFVIVLAATMVADAASLPRLGELAFFGLAGSFGISVVAFVVVAPQVLLLLNLITWLSLRMPRGALALGLALSITGNLLAGLLGTVTFGLGFLPIPVVALLLAATLYARTLDKLEQLAAEN